MSLTCSSLVFWSELLAAEWQPLWLTVTSKPLLPKQDYCKHMSGHSHAKKIMHEKGAADSKRSQIFSKLAKELTIAAKESGGNDPMANPRLRTVMEKAKAANMPADNVERAVKRAAGG